jgi:hypothetical protein
MSRLWKAKWTQWIERGACPAGPSASQDTAVDSSRVMRPAGAASALSHEAPLRRDRPARPERGPSGELEWWQRFLTADELRHVRGPGRRERAPSRPPTYYAAPRRS